MKKFLFGGLGIVIFLALGLMLLGVYINYRGESQIANRMDMRAIALRGAAAGQRELYPLLELSMVTVQTDNMTDVTALVDGQIEGLMVEKNSKVRAGDPICTVVNEEISLKLQEIDSHLLEAEAKRKNAMSNYHRYQRLWEREAASAEKYDAVETEYRAAEARIEALEAQKRQLMLQSSRQLLVSPVDGVVQLIYYADRSFVRAGTPIVLIAAQNHHEIQGT